MFFELVKHETKWRSKNYKNNRMKRSVVFAYLAVLLIIGLYFWTKAAIAGNIDPTLNWNIFFGVPFTILAISAGAMNREWKNNTVGWWLSLPYSRMTLVLAKFLSNLWRALLIVVAIDILAILAFLYAMIFDPHLTINSFGKFLLAGANLTIVLVVISPLIVSLGMLTAVLGRTGYRFFVPMVWVIFGVLWSFAISSYFQQVFGEVKVHYFFLLKPSLIALVPCCLLVYVFLRLVAYVLEKRLNL